MPEGLEAEIYRRSAERCIGRTVAAVEIDDRQVMAFEIRSTLPAGTVTAARRIGKLLLLDLAFDSVAGPTFGVHFGMTGRLVVDGAAPIERLEYGSGRDDPAWDRLTIRFTDGGLLRVNDPRRWAVFTLDADETRYGPDMFDIDGGALATSFGRRRAAVKAVMLDQTVIAGLGNLCVDEVLWQAGVSPLAPVGSLDRPRVEALVAAMRTNLPAMLELGGSHRGVIDPETRVALPPCPRDGAPMRRQTIGGRTTVWCPFHQL